MGLQLGVVSRRSLALMGAQVAIAMADRLDPYRKLRDLMEPALKEENQGST